MEHLEIVYVLPEIARNHEGGGRVRFCPRQCNISTSAPPVPLVGSLDG